MREREFMLKHERQKKIQKHCGKGKYCQYIPVNDEL